MSDNRDDRNETGENNAANGRQGAAKGNQGGGKGNGRLKLVKSERSDLEALAAIRDSEPQPIAPYYEVIWHNATLSAGVWYHGVSTDKDGVEHFKKPQKLADPFEIVGRGQDFEGNEYRVIEFKRNGRTERRALPMDIVGRPDGWGFLRGLGIGVKQGSMLMGLLADYIQWEGSAEVWQVVRRGGWCDKHFSAYVLPSGEVLGSPEGKVIYIGDTSKQEAFQSAGSVAQWQAEIGRYLAGNSRPLLALGMVFAAPLLRLVKQESGGFHFFGSSSIGKSISGLIAVSALGDPSRLKVQWKGTSLGFDNEAASNNDGLLFLDEISEADPKTAKEVAYSVFNGQSKLQGAAKGGNRGRLSWTVAAISTGEYDLENYLRAAGFELNAGQAVRLPSIPADAGKGYGAFDELHGFADGKSLAVHLEEAAKSLYGTVFRAYVAELVQRLHTEPEALKGRLKALQGEFEAQLPPDLASQPARAARRFVLAAAALELATEWGITGLERGTGFAGVLSCFGAWYERDGGGNREDRIIRKSARDFLQAYGQSSKYFVNLADVGIGGNYQPDYAEFWGFVVPANYEDGSTGKPRYFLTDKVFEEYICKGFDPRKVCQVLTVDGWMRKDGKHNRIKLPRKAVELNLLCVKRMYCFVGDVPPDEAAEQI